jgi:hypothetical protein
LAKFVHRGDADEVTESNAVDAITSAVRQLGERVRTTVGIPDLKLVSRVATSVQGAPASASALGTAGVSWRFASTSGTDLGVVSLVPY